MSAKAEFPPNWPDVESKTQQVEKVRPADIQGVADQFRQASKDSADHSAALRNATAVLGGGTWTGPQADAFFDYVKKIGDAGQKVNDHLDEVANELGNLQSFLDRTQKEVQQLRDDAHTKIDGMNQQAQAAADAAQAQVDAANSKQEGATMPAKMPDAIIAENLQATTAVANDANSQIGDKLNAANQEIQRVMGLVQQDVQGGYDSVPPLGTAPSSMKSTGGLHGGGSGGGGGGGGSHGGGGGGGGAGGLGSSGGPPSGQPPGNVQQWIEQAIKELQAAGVNVTDADIKNIWAIIEHESGGNPNAINLWDSNAQAGHPSKGLMQCIDSTFNANKLPGHDDIYNPVDNIIAGVRYTIGRYGSIANTPGLASMAHGGGYVGY
ncbi:transglycosylase SLT domain-containing protein [Amycolatopsis sp. K13G38]|uniref:Transglycosylase SLT domain-containing protein n=1 Tax=Amycolatopsis acididurans TaxID=2724524 RepID=A0ABX1J810_9PSEU|nr:transglycosylase SLT domain-containing protein [Amycolatopsis acididurans]NKQ55922.1 transglycosylase SLT domain-containing protein [Amycolatopsis acididurans]